MKPVHLLLALLVVVIWGMAFVATKVGLQDFTPPQLTAIRFVIAAVPALFVARPPIPWAMLVAIGMTLFTGQFLFQFFGIANGVPAGLAAVIVQTQALFTVALAAFLLREKPTPWQLVGMAVAAAGLLLIAETVGADLSPIGLALIMVSPISFAIGNILLKRAGNADMFNMIAWLSLVPPLPSLALSIFMDGPTALPEALGQASWLSLGSAIYLGVVATAIGYAVWADLLRHYSAVMVAPFALLVPFVGAGAAALLLGERFGPLRLAGMGLVLFGLAVIMMPSRRHASMTATDVAPPPA